MATQETSLSRALGLEFEKQEDCDVVFSVNGKTIGAHRLMLKIKSQVLYEMAVGWNHDKEPIAIQDTDFTSFKSLLRYIYTNEIIITKKNVLPFLSCAVVYKMYDLEELCVAHVNMYMVKENFCIYMNEALNFNSTVLQKYCQKIFSEATDKISQDESFLELSQPALSALLDTESTNILEITLFNRVYRWMRKQCLDQHLTFNGTNMRKVIGNALYKIRFPTMTVQDFANSVTTNKGFLTDSEMAQVFQKITVFDNQDLECIFPSRYRCRRNHQYTPFLDAEQLSKEHILYLFDDEHRYDFISAMHYVKYATNGQELDMTSFRILVQCYADLLNSSSSVINASPDNQNIRNQLCDEFDIWQKIVSTKNNHDIMTKFTDYRKKLNEICG